MGGPPSGAGALVGQRLGKYDLLALLALGGTAEIYLARIDGMAGFEKYVVVKCLHDHLAEDQDFVSMFLDEARLGAVLDHSNIVQTLALGEHQGRYYMVMEYIAGLSLALVGRRAHERVRGGKVPVPIVLNAAAQACAGLHYAHGRTEGGKPLKLVHRDVSPQNLVITFEGITKVVDFGIAKAEYRETRTRSGTVKGKFAYMSPEQCQAKDVDARTDVFALGTIVWELLTGRRLFKRDSTYETYQAVVECRVPSPSSINHELDPALDRLVMTALAKDPDARYPSAEAFGETMIAYLHQRGKASGPGEIARFFDEHFAQEIDDHAGRMRELIEGRKRSLADQQQLQWDSSELDGSASVMDSELLEEIIEESIKAPSPARLADAARASTVPERPGRPGRETTPAIPPTAAMRLTGQRAANAPPAIDTVDDEAEAESFSGSIQDLEDEIPAEATRIEANPAQLLADLDAHAGRRAPTARPVPEPGSRRPGSQSSSPVAPPRKSVGVVTPPGLRTTGAPLDPLPHERDPMMNVPVTPPGIMTSAPPPGRGGFSTAPANVPTQLVGPGPAPSPSQLASKFTDVPTQLVEPAPGPAPARGGFASAPAQVPTVIAPDRGRASTPPPVSAPASRRPTMPPPEVASTRPTMMEMPAPVPPQDAVNPYDVPTAPAVQPAPNAYDAPTAQAVQPYGYDPNAQHAPDPAAMIGLPPVEQVYPGYYPQGYPNQPQGPYAGYDGTLRTTPVQKWPPWLLGVIFFIVLALATGITVAIARAVSG